MRESIGGGLLFNLVITFVIIMIGVFVASLAYSKAYKAKNKIIDILEDYGAETDTPPIAEINNVLGDLGYNENNGRTCSPTKGGTIYPINVSEKAYDYCIEKIKTKSGYYYRVSTYMHLDIPIVGRIFSTAITGETKNIYSTYVNIYGEEKNK